MDDMKGKLDCIATSTWETKPNHVSALGDQARSHNRDNKEGTLDPVAMTMWEIEVDYANASRD